MLRPCLGVGKGGDMDRLDFLTQLATPPGKRVLPDHSKNRRRWMEYRRRWCSSRCVAVAGPVPLTRMWRTGTLSGSCCADVGSVPAWTTHVWSGPGSIRSIYSPTSPRSTGLWADCRPGSDVRRVAGSCDICASRRSRSCETISIAGIVSCRLPARPSILRNMTKWPHERMSP